MRILYIFPNHHVKNRHFKADSMRSTGVAELSRNQIEWPEGFIMYRAIESREDMLKLMGVVAVDLVMYHGSWFQLAPTYLAGEVATRLQALVRRPGA